MESTTEDLDNIKVKYLSLLHNSKLTPMLKINIVKNNPLLPNTNFFSKAKVKPLLW